MTQTTAVGGAFKGAIMALTRIKTDNITDQKVTNDKIEDGTLTIEKLDLSGGGTLFDGQVLTANSALDAGFEFTTVIPLGTVNTSTVVLKLDLLGSAITSLDTVSYPLPSGFSQIAIDTVDGTLTLGHTTGRPPTSISYYAIDPVQEDKYFHRLPNNSSLKVSIDSEAGFGSEVTLNFNVGALGLGAPVNSGSHVMIVMSF